MDEKVTQNLEKQEKSARRRHLFLGVINVSLGAAFLGMHFAQKRQEAYAGGVYTLKGDIGTPEEPKVRTLEFFARDMDEIVRGIPAKELRTAIPTDMQNDLLQAQHQISSQKTFNVLINIVPGVGFIALGLTEIARGLRKPRQSPAAPLAEGEMSQRVIDSRTKNSETSMLR